MLPLRFGYLILVFVGMIFWIIFFITRKDLRVFMVKMGIFYGLLSVVTAWIWWTIDWWHPITLTGTRVGIEDFFTGFGAGPVMAVIYQVFFRKRIVGQIKKFPLLNFVFCILILLTIDILIRYFGVSSFWSFDIVVLVGVIVMWIARKDLILPSIWSGIVTTLCILPLYWATIIFVPGWISATYYFENLPTSFLVTGIPIVELIFWFISGLFIGILSAFTWSGRFVEQEKVSTKIY